MSVPSESQFLDQVMRKFLVSLRERQENNYDATRFSFDGVDRSNVFNLEYHKQNCCFFIANHERFCDAYSRFEDDRSRALFIELILFRLAGHLHVKLSTNTKQYWAYCREALAIPAQASQFNYKSKFGPLKRFEKVPSFDREFTIDCWPEDLASTFFIKQYFFERDPVRICPIRNEHVIDGGSCFGDTALAFAAAVGPQGRVYAFDPLESHARVILHNIAQNQLQDRIRFFPVGLGAQANTVPGPVREEEMVNPGFNLDRATPVDSIAIRSIDSLLAKGDIQRVDFLKMDIEGSELAALRGAVQTLRQFKPKLAISVYHKFADFFEIPSFIHSLDLGYRFYLDHYTIHSEETVLYADANRST